MRKKDIFLAAGLAAVSAGIMANGSAFAVNPVIVLESQDDIKLAHALADHSNLDNVTYYDEAPYPDQDHPGLSLQVDHTPTSLIFDCSDGNPLQGVTDYSLLTRPGAQYFFSHIESIKLCDAKDVDWDTLAELPNLYSLSISPRNTVGGLSDSEYAALRDETYGKPTVDISGIKKLTNLEEVTIVGVPLGSLQTIPQLRNLTGLHLVADAITDLSGMSSLPGYTTTPIAQDYSYNNVVDIDPILDICERNRSVCNELTAEELMRIFTGDNGYVRLLGNKMVIRTNSSRVELPDLFEANIEYYYNERDYTNGVRATNIDYSYGNPNVTLGSSEPNVISLSRNGKELMSVEYRLTEGGSTNTHGDGVDEESESEQKNPNTGDHSILGWAIGVAAVILASAGFAVRSRR